MGIVKIGFREEIKIIDAKKCIYERGSIEVEVKKDPKIYEKDFYIKEYNHCRYRSHAESISRYIKWCDTHNLRKSRSYCLSSLRRSRIRSWHTFPFFDHTTFWRKEGEKFPCLCLTQPYGERFENNKDHVEFITDLGFEVNWFKPSEYSLHYHSTYMIFISDPKYFKFDEKLSRW